MNIEEQIAPLSLNGIFSAIKLEADQAAAVKTSQAKIDHCMAIIKNTEPDRQGRLSALHLAADIAGEAFAKSLKAEDAEALHEALVRNRDAEVSFSVIDLHCNAGLKAASQALRPVVESVLTVAAELLEKEGASHRQAMIKSEATFGASHELHAFDQRLAATRFALAEELTEARRDPLNWLRQRGLAA